MEKPNPRNMSDVLHYPEPLTEEGKKYLTQRYKYFYEDELKKADTALQKDIKDKVDNRFVAVFIKKVVERAESNELMEVVKV